MSDDPLASVRYKIKRAKHHVKELESALVAFRETCPYETGAKKDPETGYVIHYAVRVDDPGPEVAGLAGEAIHQLRSALDHLAAQLVRSHSPRMDIDKVSFPISDEPKEGKAVPDTRVKGMSDEAIKAIDAIEPWKGGAGRDLWVLHKLNNIDKHRMLVTVVSDVTAIDHTQIFRGLVERLPVQDAAAKWFIDLTAKRPIHITNVQPIRAVKAGDELMVDVSEGADPEYKADFSFEITFNEPLVLEGPPILEALHRLTNAVELAISNLVPLL
jgi:hypothetical protein